MSANRRTAARFITSLHILHHHRIVNEFGRISIRNPDNPDTFITSTLPPILVSSLDDLSEWSIEQTAPIKPTLGTTIKAPTDPGRSEIFAHSCIYKRYPGVHCVAHLHSSELIVYGLCDANGSMLRSVSNQAGFVDEYNPIFDPANHRSKLLPDHPENLKIDHPSLGEAMARSLSDATNGPVNNSIPAHDVAFVRGNGALLWSENIESMVVKAVNLQRNARIQTEAMQQRAGSNLEITYLSIQEAQDCSRESIESSDMSWVAWATEISRMPLYRNDENALIW